MQGFKKEPDIYRHQGQKTLLLSAQQGSDLFNAHTIRS